MSNLTNQFNEVQGNGDQGMNQMQNQGGGNVLGQANASREMEEVKGQIFMAKQYPRNIFQSEQRILDNCKRPSLAQTAIYSYPRGGQRVEGPSIRLAEVLAQNWNNLSYGVVELEQKNGESVAKAYAWDLETNVRQEKIFTVPHVRHTKSGVKKLTDPRDIYEMVANNGARRMRACILGVIPGDIVDQAIEACKRTMEGNSEEPLKDRIAKMIKLFKENHGVTQEQIEDRAGYNVASFSAYDLNNFISIYNSLKDGMSKAEDWFGETKKSESKLSLDMKNEKVDTKKDEKEAETVEVEKAGDPDEAN